MRKVIVVSMLLSLLFVTPIQASIPNNNTRLRARDKKVAVLERGEHSISAIAYGITRGTIISTGMLSIVDRGKGKIEITIQTYAHVKVDRIFHTAILEHLRDDGTWVEIDRQTFDVYKEDVPDQDLGELINQYSVSRLEVEQIYRVKGIHYVILNNNAQYYRSNTTGLWIQEYP